MAGNLKGITIEFQGDTSRLDKALREVRKSTRDIDSELRKVNQSLKVVGDRIGLDKPLTFHTARHTFGVLALNDGMSLSMVSRMLGHSSTDITEKVYAEYLPMTLAEELNRLDYYFVPSMTE